MKRSVGRTSRQCSVVIGHQYDRYVSPYVVAGCRLSLVFIVAQGIGFVLCVWSDARGGRPED